ncbi:MAG: P-loop NTPase, partial [Silvanigrellaceae bacterium]|nr:P-loop NTPase [Silvanigrellaceae bacterium]
MFKNVSRGLFKRKKEGNLLLNQRIEKPLYGQKSVKNRNEANEQQASTSPLNLKRIPKIISIGGGKGGIGKSFLSANISISLATMGYKVALFDLDLGAANLHTCLGISSPKVGISDYLLNKVNQIEEIGVPAGVSGLTLYGGGQEFWQQIRPTSEQKIKLIRHLQEMDADYVILDLGAGTHTNTLDFFVFSHSGILVVLPEPTSIENAYVFLKSVLFRNIQSIAKSLEQDEITKALLEKLSDPKVTDPPIDIINKFVIDYPDIVKKILEIIMGTKIGIIMNQVRNQADAHLGNSMSQICNQY